MYTGKSFSLTKQASALDPSVQMYGKRVLDGLRAQLLKRGIKGIIGLARKFQALDV